MKKSIPISIIIVTFFFSQLIFSQSEGPFDQLIIRGVTLINGNGAPPIGPVDIVVENNITSIFTTSTFIAL